MNPATANLERAIAACTAAVLALSEAPQFPLIRALEYAIKDARELMRDELGVRE